MQDNYIVYYSLQFSCSPLSTQGIIKSFSKFAEKEGPVCPVALAEMEFFPA
jgi:hypothetical protein